MKTKIRYRWIYSEGEGEWHNADYLDDTSYDDERLSEIMDNIEITEGPRHGCRWSSFEWEKYRA